MTRSAFRQPLIMGPFSKIARVFWTQRSHCSSRKLVRDIEHRDSIGIDRLINQSKKPAITVSRSMVERVLIVIRSSLITTRVSSHITSLSSSLSMHHCILCLISAVKSYRIHQLPVVDRWGRLINSMFGSHWAESFHPSSKMFIIWSARSIMLSSIIWFIYRLAYSLSSNIIDTSITTVWR